MLCLQKVSLSTLCSWNAWFCISGKIELSQFVIWLNSQKIPFCFLIVKLLACVYGALVLFKLYLLGFLSFCAVLPCLCKIPARSFPSADPVLVTREAEEFVNFGHFRLRWGGGEGNGGCTVSCGSVTFLKLRYLTWKRKLTFNERSASPLFCNSIFLSQRWATEKLAVGNTLVHPPYLPCSWLWVAVKTLPLPAANPGGAFCLFLSSQ